MLGTAITNVDYQTQQLQGGTLGDVRLVTGMAEAADGRNLPYKVVMKTQKKWERPGDPDSWRREYDLYMSDFNTIFTDSLRWPECYHAEMRDDEMELWLEYIDGVSGEALTVEMMEHAATELGCLQGRVHSQPDLLLDISCLGDIGFMEREHRQWHTQTFTYEFLISEQCRLPGFLKKMLKDGAIQLVEGKSFEYGVLRSRGCDIPEHLKQMLIDIDGRKEEIFNNLKNLPVVLCHRDFWVENIFLSDKKPVLIDWDTTGWGYLGEDIASLIVDDTDADYLDEYYSKLIPAYLKGISEHMDVSAIENLHIWEMIIIKFGYRVMQEYMFSESPDIKSQQVKKLQKIYDIRKYANGASANL